MRVIERFEALLQQGQDNALFRFGLGNAYLEADEPQKACIHLRAAVVHVSDYSAAWKRLGQALLACGEPQQAIEAYQSGIQAAERKGDVQAGKEMRVFLKRAQRTLDQ